MSRLKKVLLISTILLLMIALVISFWPAFPFNWSLIAVVQNVSVTSRFEKLIPRNTINFASFYGTYIFPYDFFAADTDFQKWRALSNEKVALLPSAEKETYELVRWAETLGINTLKTSQFFPVKVMARCGIDFSQDKLEVIQEGDHPILILPPLTITEFQILDEPLSDWPDFPFSVQTWRDTIQTLKPRLTQLVRQDSGLEQIAEENGIRQLSQLARSVGYHRVKIQFRSP